MGNGTWMERPRVGRGEGVCERGRGGGERRKRERETSRITNPNKLHAQA